MLARARDSGAAPRPFPEKIGRYELLLPIGTGGMATVYLARVRGVGGFTREVALKLMHAHLREIMDPSVDPLDEARLASRIRHPNAVPVLDVGEDAFGIYLVMDYVEGDSLAGLCTSMATKNEPIAARIALRILCDALAGLHAAHELCDDSGTQLGIVHRDFSPHNILVGIDGTTRLTDFGIAKTTARSHATEPGLIKGKIRYMAPEQARGGRIDRRADVWAAGVVAWEALAGRRLHDTTDDLDTLLRIVTETPPRLRTALPEVPLAIDEVIAGALVRDVDDRWPTADAFRRALIDAVGGHGALAESSEVATFVRTIAQTKLDRRRSKVDQVLRLRNEMGKVIEPSPGIDGDETSGPPGAGAVFESADDRESELQPAESSGTAALPTTAWSPPRSSFTPRRTRGRRTRIAAAAVAAVLALAVGGLVRFARRTPPSVEPAPPSVAESAPSPPTEAAQEDRPLTLTADAPIAQVRVGSRRVSIAPPANEVMIQLAPEERAPLDVEIIAEDGRFAAIHVDGTSRRRSIAFGPAPIELPPIEETSLPTTTKPPPRPSKSTSAPRPHTTTDSVDAAPLATSPYKKKQP